MRTGTYEIYPLHLGDITRDNSNMMYLKDPGRKNVYPILAYLLVGRERKILIDTGGSPPDGVRYQPYTRPEGQEITARLKNLGLAPDEISDVILTHLHWDHAGANELFGGAAFYAQRRELRYAKDPLPVHINSYDPKLVFRTDYRLLDGSADLFEGVRVILTPGHSPGSQSVVVATEEGEYAVVGDLIALYACFEADPMTANGIHTDLYSYYDSLRAVKNLQCPILPGHDPLVLRHRVYPH